LKQNIENEQERAYGMLKQVISRTAKHENDKRRKDVRPTPFGTDA